mmetsp:Transcript_67567/g.135723  ORF Transcript_67567/g.135723 Transcript_67567/m.135723 type:complete len:245 (-) Transcript_67567:172-906(-)|eukprot:CAMPEP_0113819100 /NCGR_PEP_ID=MMETSP0328-20130328/571_1 /TAXON_ID=39455 /ORGANISM="Alexandrium minutum" /LENGTH=244 /DNA_ID=CAMNT_0000787035 /DNA_START=121 /DNA_END=855 /DNA_ORIENTATION=- /assembly_acc=CAM_ASM_000350
MVRLGFITLPLSGDFNSIFIFTGLFIAITLTTITFNLVTPKGPALAAGTPEQIIDALGKVLVAQSLWCIIYYNYIGAQVLCIFFTGPWQVFDSKKHTDKYAANASRFSGNTMEHAPVFIPCMWAYAMFVDYETGGALGILYCANRAIYPLFYVLQGRFTFWFENITQTGYAVNGTFILGMLLRAAKVNVALYAMDNRVTIPILGSILGVFMLLPGIGLTVPWFVAHTVADRKRQAAKMQEVVPA